MSAVAVNSTLARGVSFYKTTVGDNFKRMTAILSAALERADVVITGGGIRGRVTKVTDEEAEVEIAQGTRVRVVKSTISHVVTKPTKPAND